MFENLQSYYDYIESDNSLLYEFNVSKGLINLRDKSEDNEKSYCSYELFFTDFRIQKSAVKPQMSGTDKDGKIYSYPNFDLFVDDFEYVKLRSKNVINPKYKAKYNHLLWESKHKHFDYAKLAVDSYYTFLSESRFSLEDNLSNHAFQTTYENLFTLSQSINYKKDEVVQFLISILDTKKINGYKEGALMQYVIDEGKKMELTVLQSFQAYINKAIDNNIHPEFTDHYLKLMITICPKLNLSAKPYQIKLAEYYIEQSKTAQKGFHANRFYLKALAEYQKAGEKEGMESVAVLIEENKKHLDFKLVQFDSANESTGLNELLKKYVEHMNETIDRLIDESTSTEIYEYVIVQNIFPKAEELTKIVRPATFEMISVETYDINRNIVDNKNAGIHPYLLHVQNFSLRHLWMIFLRGIKNGKVSYETLIEYLKNNTWYGQDFDEKDGFNWIELLSPALLSFFSQSEIDIKLGKNSNQGYILAIDSLVIKFEGLLRELSRLIGAQTIEIKENETQERIGFDKLLDNQKIKDLIPEDDIALFKFLFTSDGMNLRNNIAHSFYKTHNYSSGTMLLLICAVLRLGNYKITKNKPK